MTRAEKQEWERDRAQGLGRFILRFGLLRRGILFGAIFGAWLFIYHSFFSSSHRSRGSIIFGWTVATVVYGTLMGVYSWRRREREYQEPEEDDHVA